MLEVVVSPGVFDTGSSSAVPLQVYKVTGLDLNAALLDGPNYALVHVSKQVSPGQTSFWRMFITFNISAIQVQLDFELESLHIIFTLSIFFTNILFKKI